MSHEGWQTRGCETCRQGILRGSEPEPARIRHLGGGAFLHRCSRCGSWWEVNLREAHVVFPEEQEGSSDGGGESEEAP